MINNNNIKNLNVSEKPQNEAISTSEEQSPIFYENSLLDSYPEENKKKLEQVHRVIDFIKNNQGLHISEIARRMNMARTTLNSIITNLEFAKVTYSKMSMKKNTAVRLIFYSAEPNKEAEELDTPCPSIQLKEGGENGRI